MAKGSNLNIILDIVNLAMRINDSCRNKAQIFVSVSPHIKEIQVDIYNFGWSHDTYPNETYRARYDFAHRNDEIMTNHIPEIKNVSVSCNINYIQKKLYELAMEEVKRNG